MPTYNVQFNKLKCLEETDEWGSDEPYFIFLIVDWHESRLKKNYGMPYVRVKRTKIFQDVDEGETRKQKKRLWGPVPGETWAEMKVLKQLIIVQGVEHDHSNVSGICDWLDAFMRVYVPFYYYKYYRPRIDDSTDSNKIKEARGYFRRALKKWMYRVIDGKLYLPSKWELTGLLVSRGLIGSGEPLAIVAGSVYLSWYYVSRDDRIQARQLVIYRAALDKVKSGGSISLTTTHTGDGGKYKAWYKLSGMP